MKIVIAVDKVHGDVVSGLVEKIAAYSCKTIWQRRKIDCCAHVHSSLVGAREHKC
ncbi:hypothetical protein [Holospora elegans]|uniref:hypothetical protein n=1 Tax=Holospora elegans TaxID=431043 RepID=UPI00139F2B6E|nr:hypothetical protein [Holospora elegans]